MLAHQVGGLWIMILGVAVFVSSFLMTRLCSRSHGVLSLIDSPLLQWMTRLLGSIVFCLGLVTFWR